MNTGSHYLVIAFQFGFVYIFFKNEITRASYIDFDDFGHDSIHLLVGYIRSANVFMEFLIV